ncbi:translocation/assembly module TamB domain-containing protein [Acetobacter sp. AN02]|uniref:translocation/assembly module TamB domain-containing protein n=1 Tax=Acetobacter sp. AN02 TaxID=2894186 RepID=UPI0024345205|nr:translocation/assembly module TamB domain-containing protein [Acetobacter sp. AN02]MDG6095036.1 translocation/assembly module TamB domain-containing protein [Acetobacter sp. AN02]
MTDQDMPPQEKPVRAKRSLMRRVLRIAGIGAAGVAGLVVTVVVVALAGANTGAGRHFIERQTTSLTGGMVRLTGLSGRFPDALHAGKIELADARGVWLTLEGLDLDWSPLRLIGKSVHVDLLHCDRLAIPRLPESSAPEKPAEPASSAPMRLGLSIDIGKVDAKRIEVGAPVAGLDVAVSLSGHARINNLDDITADFALTHLPDTDIALDLQSLKTPTRISLSTKLRAKNLMLHLDGSDGPGGFAQTLSGMDSIVPVALRLDMDGPTSALALNFKAEAGKISASTTGTLNLPASEADIAIKAQSPAMTLLPGVAWGGIDLKAKLRGKLSAPQGSGALVIDRLTAAGVALSRADILFDGMNAGSMPDRLQLHAKLAGLTVPGPAPALLAQSPVELDATYMPDQSGRPVMLSLQHPLIRLEANAQTQPAVKLRATLDLPDLRPLAAVGKQQLTGHAHLTANAALPEKLSGPTSLDLNGDISLQGGQPQAVKLIGPSGRLALGVVMTPAGADGKDIRLRTLFLSGRAISLTAAGLAEQRIVGGKDQTSVDLSADLGLPDLRALADSVRGTTKLHLSARGLTDDLAATAHLETDPATATLARSPLTLDASFTHLPGKPQGELKAAGTLDRAPLSLAVGLTQDAENTRHIALEALKWNSLSGSGTLDLPDGAVVPLGQIGLKMTRLADLSRIIGQQTAGSVELSVHTTAAPGGKPRADLKLDGAGISVPQVQIGRLSLAGSVADPAGAPVTDLKLAVDRLTAPSVSGAVSAKAKGPQTALALTAQGRFADIAGDPGVLDMAALLDVPGKKIRIDRLSATAKHEDLRLQKPVTAAFGDKIGVDRLLASLGPQGTAPAAIDIAGTVKPALAMTVSVDHITPALANPFVPGLKAGGMLSLKAKLSGTTDSPGGHAEIHGTDLRMLSGDAASLPPLKLDAAADMAGKSAKIDVRASAGPKLGLQVSGKAPLSATEPMAIRATGMADLSIADAVLGAAGRQAHGQVDLNLAVSGTASAPRASGTVALHKGDVQDFAQGLHLSGIEALIEAQGDDILIRSFRAEAGRGSMTLTGHVGALAPGMPVDLHFQADKARPVASDLITAVMDADIAIRGQAKSRIDVTGKVDLPHVDVNIPSSMPASVAHLDVIRPGEKAPGTGAQTAGLVTGLDLKIHSPGEFYVRGHGLDAEMSGLLHVSGTAAAPQIEGGFNLKRGLFSLAGINLNFTHGRVGFDGSGVQHRLDPTLDFQADRNVAGKTAMLKIGGYASDPKISFESLPPLPQDEVVAMLLFGQEARNLSATQMAEVAASVAALAGSSTFDPLGTIRKTLGLDRLAVGGGVGGVGNGGGSIEAGRYVMKGVYVGAKQATSGSGTQAQVQVDLMRHLKLNTTVGTGGNVTGFTTPENDPGSSVGLLWQYRY